MAMKLTGLMSGMDTDSIIQDLVAVRRKKVDAQVKAQTKLEWKQEAWKELNGKIKNLQNRFISDMRLQGSYGKKTTKSSDESAVNIITGNNAVDCVQELQVKKLAKTAYMTGGVVKGANGGRVTAMTKVSDLVFGEGDSEQSFSGNTTLELTKGGKTTKIEITENTTISDLLNKFKDAGLNASFDASNQRFFISAKSSGAKNDFSLNAYDAEGMNALQALGLQVGMKDSEGKDSAALTAYKEMSQYYVIGEDGNPDEAASLAKMADMISKEAESRVNSYLADYKKWLTDRDATQKKIDELNEKYKDDPLKAVSEYESEIETLKSSMEKLSGDDLKTAEENLAKLETAKKDAEALEKYTTKLTELETDIDDGIDKGYVEGVVKKVEDGKVTYEVSDQVTATDTLKEAKELEAGEYCYEKAKFAYGVVGDNTKAGTASAVKMDGSDSEISLNGATFTGTGNVFEINGLTITALRETKDNEIITLTTQKDVDGIYDIVKNFMKEYNSLINEMDKLYNADAAKGFEPLTDEEKEALSETEVEKYEKKIKDALLRRDSNLNSVSSVMKEAMSSGYMVNGKMMYLSDFGINTLGYFGAADNEKNAYHIDGDKDDAATAGKDDVLRQMISKDSDTVVSFFTSLANNLYDKMDGLTRSVNGYRSYGNFYDDKKLKDDYKDYTSKIAKMEQKLADYEDKWYAKFSAMEKAMSKMQNNANAVSSLIGGM